MAVDLSAMAPPARVARKPRTPRVSSTQGTTRTKPSSVEARTEGLMNLAQLAQGALLLAKQHADAATVGMHAPPLALELAKLAESEPVIAKGIDYLIQAGPYAALIGAALPFAMQLAANHGLIPPNTQGVTHPDILKSRIETQILQMQAAAMREQQDALREAQEARAAYSEYAASANGASGGQPTPEG